MKFAKDHQKDSYNKTNIHLYEKKILNKMTYTPFIK
jgi:hypothetical protein